MQGALDLGTRSRILRGFFEVEAIAMDKAREGSSKGAIVVGEGASCNRGKMEMTMKEGIRSSIGLEA